MTKEGQPVTALLLAGSRPPDAERGLGRGDIPKPLIEIGGRTMLNRVASALSAVPGVGQIRIISQEGEKLAARAALGGPGIVTRVSGDSVSTAVLAELAADGNYLVTTADHPLLTPAMVDTFLQKARTSGADICVGMVERETLVARFPKSKRTWLKFRGGAYTGANLFYISAPRGRAAVELWRTVEQQRKVGRAIVGAFGPLLLMGVLIRLLTLQQAIGLGARRIGCTAAAIILDEAEAAIDVDNEADLIQVTSILKRREETAVHG